MNSNRSEAAFKAAATRKANAIAREQALQAEAHKQKLSEAGKKAWATRIANKAIKEADAKKAEYSLRAKKAWETRKAKALVS